MNSNDIKNIRHLQTSRGLNKPKHQTKTTYTLLVLTLFPALFDPSVLTNSSFLGGQPTIMKAVSFAGLILLGLAYGIKTPPRGTLLIIGTICASTIITWLRPDLSAVSYLSREQLLTSSIGYLLLWIPVFINFEQVDKARIFKVISILPLAALALSLILQVLGLAPFIRQEYTGAFRLSGSLAPAYMGSAGMFGAIAGTWLWVHKEKNAMIFIVIGLITALASGTRGASLTGAIVVFGTIFFSRQKNRKAILSKLFLFSLGIVALYWFIPNLIERSTNQGKDNSGDSGRSLAWEYYLNRFQEHQFLGWGPGANGTLPSGAGNTIVKNISAPHNTYIQILVDYGLLLGGIFFLGLLVVSVSTFKRAASIERVFVFFTLISMAIYSYNDNLISAHLNCITFGFILAALQLSSSQPELLNKKEDHKPENQSRENYSYKN